MAGLKRLWERTPDPWQPAMLDAADTAALETAAEHTVEEDHGVQIRGFFGSGTKRGELFLGLGEGTPAVEFENRLHEVTSAL